MVSTSSKNVSIQVVLKGALAKFCGGLVFGTDNHSAHVTLSKVYQRMHR